MRLRAALKSRLAGYAVINAFAAAGTFLAVPVLVRLVGLEGFGTWSVIEPIVFFGTALALLGSDHGIIRNVAFDGEDVRDVLGQILATAGVPILATAAVAGLLATLVVSPVFAMPIAALCLVEGFLLMALAAARASGRVGPFAIGQIGRTVGFLATLSFASLAGWPFSVEDALWLRCGLVAALALIVLLMLRPRLGLAPRRYLSALRYGSFILVSSLVTMGLEMADRYLVQAFAGASAVGAYMIHVKVASIVGQGIVMPFSLWFAPERLRRMENDADGGGAFFKGVALGLTLICCAISGGAFLAGPLIVELMAPEVAFDPLSQGALLIAASLIGLTYALNIGLLRPGMTHLNILPVVVGVGVMLAIGLLFVPVMGPPGAAIARLVGTLVWLVILAWVSQRVYHVSFSYATIVAVGLATIVVVASIDRLLPVADPWDLLTILLRLGALGLVAGAVAGGLAAARIRTPRRAE